MTPSPYTEDVLRGCFRVGDSGRWKIDLNTDLESVVQSAIARLNATPPSLSISPKADKSGTQFYSSDDIETSILLRATYRRLVKQYKIRLPNREAIISGILEAVSEATPYLVIRCDIRKFFESIDARPLVQRIIADTRTSPQLRLVLEHLYSVGGLPTNLAPRGLAISTVLSELLLVNFDESVRKFPGVHRYFRYADDMLLFTLPDCGALSEVERLVSGIGLSLNEKTEVTKVDSQTPKKPEVKARFSFLGYNFEATNRVRTFESRSFSVSIASQKLKKRQSRLIVALKAFAKDGDGRLLIDRVKYLSSNHSVYRTKHTRGSLREKIRTGIYYNYAHCGYYPGSERGRTRLEHHAFELVALDGSLSALLFGANSPYSAQVIKLPKPLIDELRLLSFAQGYKKRIIRRYSRDRVRQICRVWGNG
jgi:Reverse transcriptase (RNA-dependent DNA polymerase)